MLSMTPNANFQVSDPQSHLGEAYDDKINIY